MIRETQFIASATGDDGGRLSMTTTGDDGQTAGLTKKLRYAILRTLILGPDERTRVA